MGPLRAIGTAFAKTLSFSGRASRSEYWWYFAMYSIVIGVCAYFDFVMVIALVEQGGEQALNVLGVFDFKSSIAWIVMVIPTISLTVRRLHDAGFSGLWTLLYFVPLGAVALLIMHVLPSADSTTVHGTPASGPSVDRKGKAATMDSQKRAMQGYALLFDKDKLPSPETKAARKAEISEYYRTQVLKSAPTA